NADDGARFAQVPGLEPLGEPGEERREERARIGVAALVAPHAGEADRGAQLEGAGRLLARERHRTPQHRFGPVAVAAEEALGLRVDAEELGVPERLDALPRERERAFDRARAVLVAPATVLRVPDDREDHRHERLVSRRGGDARALEDLFESVLVVLDRSRPAAEDEAHRVPCREAVLARDRDRALRELAGAGRLAPQEVDDGPEAVREGMARRLREHARLLGALARAIRKAEHPKRVRLPEHRPGPEVGAEAED